MSKPKKTAREIETLMMQQLRGKMVCHGLTGLVIAPDGPDRWDVKALVRGKDVMPSDCWDEAHRILRELREQFEIVA